MSLGRRVRVGIDFDSTVARIDVPWLARLNALRGTSYRAEDWTDWNLSFLREADRDLAKGLTVPDICRKVGIAQTTYYRWRQQYAPEQVDTDRRCRELEVEVDRLKRLVAELLLDKQMLQDIAKKKW